MKRILLILIIVVAIGAGLYFGRAYIFKSSAPDTVIIPPVDTTTDTNATVETADPLTLIGDTQIFDYWTDPSDRTTYFIDTKGSIGRIRAGGTSEEIFKLNIADLSNVMPAPKGVSVLVSSGYAGNQYFSLIDPLTKTRQFLPLGASAGAWSPDAKEVVFLKNQTLNIFTVSSGKSRFIANINMTDAVLDWKKPKEIYIGSRPSAGVLGQWFSYNLVNKTLLALTEELPGLVVRFANNGIDSLQFSNQNGLLKNTTNLNTKSLPEKCTPPATVIYCGELIGANIKELPDAYYQHRLTSDNIVRLDATGYPPKKTIYFASENDRQIDVYHPTIVGQSLYFINRNDQRLYSLGL